MDKTYTGTVRYNIHQAMNNIEKILIRTSGQDIANRILVMDELLKIQSETDGLLMDVEQGSELLAEARAEKKGEHFSGGKE